MMNKTTIEDRDRDLIKKIRQIVKEKGQPEQQASQKRPWFVFTLAGFIMVGMIMIMIYYMIPERVLTDPPSIPEKFETASLKNPGAMAQDTLTDVGKPDLSNEAPSQKLPAETPPLLPAKEVPPQAEPMETLPETVPTNDVAIHELVICRGVKNRQYLSAGNHFSMKNGAKPVVWTWMNVLTDKPPQSLSHIYYLNGERYCRVILPAPYPRTRTWSNVKLNRPELAGSWRVDVVNSNGQVIARAEFTVEG